MPGFGGFYKGEKKKPKKDKDQKNSSVNAFGAPTFSLPEIVSKKKKEE